MVEIFDIKDRRVALTPTVMLIPELRALIDEYPEDYMKAISYVAFMTDPTARNPYGELLDEAREEALAKDFAGSYKPTDKVICTAIKKMEYLNDTVINKYYRQVRALVGKLGNWAENVIIDDGREGNMAHVLRTIKDIGTVTKQFMEAEKAKMEEEKKARGNKKLAYDTELH